MNRSTGNAPVMILILSIAALAASCNAPSSSPTIDPPNGTLEGSGPGNPIHSDYAVVNQCLSASASVVGFSNTAIQISGNGSLEGNIALLGASTLDLTGNAKVSGEVFTPSSDQVTTTGNASAGQIVDEDLTENESAVLGFGESLDQLSETQTLDEIHSSMTLQGNGNLNVIDVNGDVSLSGNDSLILNGSSTDLFLINVAGNVTVSGKANIEVSGTLPAQNVLFRLVGDSGSVTISGNGTVMGTFFAPKGSAVISGNGIIEGSVFAWNSIVISGNGFTFSPAPFCPGKFIPAPSPSPSPSGSASPSPSPSPSGSASPSPSPSPSGSASPSPSPSPSGSVSPSPSPSPSASSCTGPFCGGGLLGQ